MKDFKFPLFEKVLSHRKNKLIRFVSLFVMMVLLLDAVFSVAVIKGDAKSYVTIHINYLYINGTPITDPYIATFPLNEDQSYEVTNPIVDGFDPMMLENDENDPMELPTGGVFAEATTVSYDHTVDGEEVVYNVYYVAGLTHYAARYYLQNKYDDLYTLDRDRTDANQNRLGKTGSTPDDLEAEKIPGFTSLFHEPDAIAADGSTVFRVYYDRNYYAITYNLGEGGYGVDPIYAKYETSYRLENPKRQGYTFLGWARTSSDSSEEASGASDWVYIQPDTVVDVTKEDDGEGNKVQVTHYYRNAAAFEAGTECTLADVTMTEADATDPQNLVQFADRTDLTVPSYNSYWKAIWAKGDSKFSVVYWVENEDSELADNYFEQLDVSSMTSAELRAIVTPHYTDVAVFEADKIKIGNQVKNVQSGEHIQYNTQIQRADGTWIELSNFFGFNFKPQAQNSDGTPKTNSEGYPLDDKNKKIDFPNMSLAQRDGFAEDLQRYYDRNDPVSLFQFGNDAVNGYVEAAGDGSTKINIFYKRKTFNLQFFYAKTTGGTVTYDANGVPSWDKGSNGQVSLTSGTKNFSGKSESLSLYEKLNSSDWKSKLSDDIPAIIRHQDMMTTNFVDNGSGGDIRYWYYQVQAKFGSSLRDKWFNDAFETPHRNDKPNDPDEKIYFGSWAVEPGSRYKLNRANYTIKGLYERLYGEILLRDNYIKDRLKTNSDFDYTTLHFVASWDNTNGGNGWNNGKKYLFNFTYKNCVELLPSEDYIASTPNGINILINGGTYPAGDHEELDEDGNLVEVHYMSRTIEGRYTDIIEMDTGHGIKLFGLTKKNTIETYDAGNQYTDYSGSNLNNANVLGDNLPSNNNGIRKNQTAVSLTGFTIYGSEEDDNDANDLKTTFTVKSVVNGEVVTKTVNTNWDGTTDYGNGNAQATFYDNGNGFDERHHADIYFFYSRNDYKLKYSNLGTIDEDNIFRAYYQAPMFLQKFQIEPLYPNPELRDYFNFDGWYYDPFYLKPVDFLHDRIPDDDVILYAKWVPRKINVIFYNNYEDYYIDRKGTHPENRIVLGQDENENNITTLSIDYGTYVPLMNIPVNDNDPENPRPKLSPIAEEATFAGWYYISSRIPNRFEPENVPITTLNEESTGDNATLRLFAEWVTTDVAKYRVRYVRADDPEVEIAQQTTGRAYVFKTKTFEAKSSAELYDEYKWTSEGQESGTNWWPTTNSHSFVVRENISQGGNEYTPNDYAFEYIQKDKVHYKVQYLDAATRKPINPGAEDVVKETSHASVVEDAIIIPGYIVETATQSLTLSASANTDPDAQLAEELENNVITFLYRENDNEYLYQVDYLTQNIDDDEYTLYTSETLTVPIAAEGDTTVSISNLYNGRIASDLLTHGYQLVHGGTKYTVTDTNGVTDPNPISVADNGSVTIVATDKKTIKVYFDRKFYPYTYQYIDHTAETAYLTYLEEHKNDPDPTAGAPWNGVLQTFNPEEPGMVGEEILINAAYNYSRTVDGQTQKYVRLSNPDGTINDVKITIQPDDNNAGLNNVKVYFRRDTERKLNYQMVCVNSHIDTDYYNDAYHTPKFGRLSVSMQTVLDYNSISNITFYDNNEETTGYTNDGKPIYLHMHRYTFLGWYSTKNYDPEHPETGRLTDETTLTKADLGTDGELPERDTTYYALVKQDMVKLDVMFCYADNYTKDSFRAADDDDVAPYVQEAVDNADDPNADNKVYPDGLKAGQQTVFTSPSNYTNHADLAWHRVDGYSFSMQPIDDRVYKYEFVEWWRIVPTPQYENGEPVIDPDTGDQVIRDVLVRNYNWNSPSIEWSSDALQQQVPRNKDQYLIAVYARRTDITELPYTIEYRFTDRFGTDRTYVKTGTLSEDQLDESNANCAITNDGDYRLSDEFILANAPYESNYGETLRWSNRDGSITKDSVKEGAVIDTDTGATATENRLYATITAVQDTKKVHAHYRLTPDGGYNNDIALDYGANYKLDERMKAIDAPAVYNGMAFKYWAVRKPNRDGTAPADSAPVVAKSYDTLFDLCMMDNYFISPVYDGAAEGPGSKSAALNVTAVARGDEDWLAWTWNEGEDGVWVRPDSNLVFRGLNDNVKFARVAKGTDITGGVWDAAFESNVWNYTEDDDQTVQDGQTLILTEYYHDNSKYIAGYWSSSDPSAPETPAETPTESASITLTHLDYSRNRWTDENNEIPANGSTDLLFTDFEIAFEDNGETIQNNEDYQCGVVFEACAKFKATSSFNPSNDYGYASDAEPLKAAISAGNTTYTTTNKTGQSAVKTRSLLYSPINVHNLTNKDRIELSHCFPNNCTIVGEGENETRDYSNSNSRYLMKATAYMIKDGQVTLSNSVYVCLKSESEKDLAAGFSMTEFISAP